MNTPSAYDAVVVGTGVAGLTAALSIPDRRVLVVTKSRFGEGGSSCWAQGGVAVALGDDDSPQQHARDTIAVGGGISEVRAVDLLTRAGPELVERLMSWGASFDRGADGAIALGREAAHSRRRILHAGGDATGEEMVRALVARVGSAPWVEIRERAFVEDLAVSEGRVVGVRLRAPDGSIREVRTGAVVLATGGVGQVYRFTTNPVEVTADGLAMAARAGARLADLEFVQFHPTALAVDRDPIPLLTEAIRGEGAHLVDDLGERFMTAIHPLAELAPRDIVARGIWERRRRGRQVFLDASASTGERFSQRFPTVFASCRDHGIDPRVEPMPVTPAAHYHMGGVAVDLAGRSSLPGLWACGEAASTGAHGANRLASNSLLEALVFGARVGADLLRERPEAAVSKGSQWAVKGVEPSWPETVLRRQVRRLMWDRVGLVRSADGLRSAEDRLEELADRFHGGVGEARNLLLAARLITAAASRRRESRGAHFRSDHPEASPADASRLFATMASLLHDDDEAWRVAWRRATGSAR